MDTTRYLSLIGRVLIGVPFAMSGFGKLAAYSATTAYIASAGLPAPPLTYVIAVLVELGGGLLLIAGYQARSVALALAVFSLDSLRRPSAAVLPPEEGKAVVHNHPPRENKR